MAASPASIKVALDWTPNSNHTGFFVAKHKGYYADAGLDVSFISPHVDNYHATPASRLLTSEATFAITPSESVVSAHTHPDKSKPKLQAVATLLQSSTSAVVTLKSSGVDRPKLLDGKKYASYGARYEGRIVAQLIKNDGGKGEFIEETPAMLGIWQTLLTGNADATWVFLGWEGVEAKIKGVELNTFRLEDYNIPYGYSPLLVAHPDFLRTSPDSVRKFLEATARGFQLAAAQPKEAAAILLEAVGHEFKDQPLPADLDPRIVHDAQEYLAQHYLTPSGAWGRMDGAVWTTFVDWLSSSGLLTDKVQSRGPAGETTTSLDALRGGDAGKRLPRDQVKEEEFFTNEFLPPPTV